jgi:acetyltransferase-like isoleucine patch superfamily enzyme
MLFTGKRVELRARPGHGRLVIGPWCWIGNDNKLRSHEGQLTLGAKVVLGRDNVVNSYLDVEVGDAAILADWIYVCDFDHRTDRLDIPIKDQGIVTSRPASAATSGSGRRPACCVGSTSARVR